VLQRSNRVSQVLSKNIQPDACRAGTHLFLHLFDAAELCQGRAPRLARCHARADSDVDLPIQVRVKLVVERALPG
jgi:hypothetical protein